MELSPCHVALVAKLCEGSERRNECCTLPGSTVCVAPKGPACPAWALRPLPVLSLHSQQHHSSTACILFDQHPCTVLRACPPRKSVGHKLAIGGEAKRHFWSGLKGVISWTAQ